MSLEEYCIVHHDYDKFVRTYMEIEDKFEFLLLNKDSSNCFINMFIRSMLRQYGI